MGWLGWTADEALSTDIALVEIALSAKSDLLMMIHGTGKKQTDGKKRGKVTPDGFKAFAKRTNGARKK